MKDVRFETVLDATPGQAPVRGFVHPTPGQSVGFIVLTHGAGGNCQCSFAGCARRAVCDDRDEHAALPIFHFVSDVPNGPPSPADAQRDQEGLRRAVQLMKNKFGGRAFLGGVSYGGRQASMLVAGESSLVEGLLLLSYPLHPPGRPTQMRTAHFPKLQVPSLFVSGTRDAFGTTEELQAAIRLISARTQLVPIEGAAHGLMQKSNRDELPGRILEEFQSFFGLTNSAER